MTQKTRILFVAEAVTLAHVTRLLALARNLPTDTYEILFACDPRFDQLLAEYSFVRRRIYSVPSRDFMQALEKGRPLYDLATLDGYLDEDRRLIQECRPDVVVGDFRLSLGVSARLEGVPFLNLSNAYWSPRTKARIPVPDLPITRILGEKLAQPLFDLARPFAFALHARSINRLRQAHELAPLPRDMRYAYTDGDWTLFADLPELFPDLEEDRHQLFTGPIPWSPDIPLPRWWDALPADRPCIYVNLGSSGHHRSTPRIIQALARLPVTGILATAGNKINSPLPANVYAAPYLPGDKAAARADVVLCNGGSPSTYQALTQGKPVVGLASNLDQHLNMLRVEGAGAGIRLHSATADAEVIHDTLHYILNDACLGENARRLAAAIAGRNPFQVFENVLGSALGARTFPHHARNRR